MFNDFKPISLNVWKKVLISPEMLAITILYTLAVFFFHYLVAWIAGLNFKNQFGANKQILIGLDEKGLAIDVEEVKSFIPWEKFCKFSQIKDRILLYVSKKNAVALPKRAFASDAEWSDALNFIHQRISKKT